MATMNAQPNPRTKRGPSTTALFCWLAIWVVALFLLGWVGAFIVVPWGVGVVTIVRAFKRGLQDG